MLEPLILRMSGERLLLLLGSALCALVIVCCTIWAVVDRQLTHDIDQRCIAAGGEWERTTDTWLSCNGIRKEA